MKITPALLLLLMIAVAGCGGETPDPSSRVTAQWAIGMGGTVTCTYDGRQKETSSRADLPSGPFVLKKIVLNKTAVENDDLKKLADLTGLTHLELHETNISDEGLDHLSQLATLTELELSYTQVGDEGLQKLKQLSTLKKLFLTGTNVTEAAVEEFQKESPGCEIIRLAL